MNGINGYVVRGRGAYASASVFLPCVGDGIGKTFYNTGSYGNYWSSVPDLDRSNARYLYFDSSGHHTGDDGRRFYGRSIRPVQGFTQ